MIPELEEFLLNSIPVASHMQLRVVDYTVSSLVIRAPLHPNTNDKGTAFAGSLYSAMVLAGWMYVTWRLKTEDIDAEAVASAAKIRYVKPVMSDFEAACSLPAPEDWDRFVAKLKKRKNSKLELPVNVSVAGELKADLSGEYVAWMRSLKPYGT